MRCDVMRSNGVLTLDMARFTAFRVFLISLHMWHVQISHSSSTSLCSACSSEVVGEQNQWRRGGEQRGHRICPRAPTEVGPKGGAVIYQNSVSSVDAWMDNVLDVISSVLRFQNASKSLAAGASPQTQLRELTAFPQTPSWV